MAKASMATRKEILHSNMAKYRKADKKGKGEILDIVCAGTGLSRDRAARVLSQHRKEDQPSPRSSGKRGRKRVYDFETGRALKKIWAFMDMSCGKRLHAGMADMLDALICFNEVDFDAGTVHKLKTMSASTMDRLLKKDREALRLKGISTTKPGTLLKRDIPIRLGQEWDAAAPGFTEVDLVAHCGPTTAGEYINTLNVTDIATGWTEPITVLNKAQRWVFEGLMVVESRQPFPFKGIDSDNGSEFINRHLYEYCKNNDILFTRSRPYTKNDGCHVEQKNWSLIRRHIGYNRYEGNEALSLLNEYYALLRLHVNFFMPSAKLIEKRRDGARVWKRYEQPLTPYKRVLLDDHIPDGTKTTLTETFITLNPAELSRGMIRIREELEKLRILD